MSPLSAKPHVLIVDDTPSNRMAFESVLERDFTVTLAESGRQAVEVCRAHEFAVIILDVRMPEMNGFETAEALRKQGSTRSTPIIIFTSAFDQNIGQVTRGLRSGATDFLFNPVDPELLKLKVWTYAQFYLKHEALRLQVKQLKDGLAELHAELADRGLDVTKLKSRLQSVERTASEIDREIA